MSTPTPPAGGAPEPGADQPGYVPPPAGSYPPPPPPPPAGYPPAPPAGYGPGAYGQPMSSPPPNHLVWAILTTLFCCLPFGIVSIVFAAQVSSKWAGGDYAGAQASSDNAKRWAIISAVAGLAVVGVYVVFVLIAAAAHVS